ncbi:MAG: hypothetical protein ACK2T4_05985 [Candidatus Promineifilaceae bacterium]
MNLSPTTRKLLLGALVISTLLLSLAILADWLPWLRGPAPETSEWYWPYLLRPMQRWWPSLLAALLTLAVGTWWIYQEKPGRGRTAAALLGLFACSLFLQASLIYADRPNVSAELVDRTLSNLASGFFEPAAEIEDINQLLASYPQAMPEFVSEHARTHPPGLILANWATIQALSKTDWPANAIAAFIQPLRCMDMWIYSRPAAVAAALGVWAVLPLIAAALTIFPAYAVAEQLLKGYTIKLAAILAATLPALILFAPKSVQLYAPLTLFMFWAFHSGILNKSLWSLLTAGVLGSILTFLSLGNGALFLMLLLYGVFLIFLIPREEQADSLWKQKPRDIAVQLLSFIAGAVSIWLLYWLIWGVAPWKIAVSGLGQHYQLVTHIRRYEWWVVWNLIDLAIFSGWPLFLCFLGSLLPAFRHWKKKSLGAVDALAITLAIIILLLNFSGSARGEVGRLWLFIMPLLAFPAAYFWGKTFPEKRSAIILLALQLLLTLSLGWAWRPVRPVIVVAQEPSMPSASAQEVLDVRFANEPLRLTGYSLSSTSAAPGDSIELTLFWQSAGPASRPFTVFNQLLDENGQLVAQQDNWPVNGSWPPSCWRAGDEIVDRYTLTLPADVEPGSYRLVSGLYDAASGERVPLPEGGDTVELATITVTAP